MSTTTTYTGVRIVDMPDLGAFTSASSVVGEHAGSGRFNAASLSGYFATRPMSQTPTGQIFQNEGACINRFNDRVWVGGATASDGNNPFTPPGNVTKDWLSILQAANGLNPISEAVFASTQSPGSPNGVGLGVLGGAQSLHFTSAAQSAVGVVGFAYNNNTTLATASWAYYGESYRYNTTVANTYGFELAVIEQSGTSVHLSPYIGAPGIGFTIGLQIDSGNGFDSSVQPGLTSASAALVVSQNSTDASCPFQSGIVFFSGSLKMTAGVGEAISFAAGHALLWYNSAGSVTSGIVATSTTTTGSTNIAMAEGNLEFGMPAYGTLIAKFNVVASAVNYLTVTPNTAGKPPTITVDGADTNIGLSLLGKGTGTINVGSIVQPYLDNAFSLGVSGARWDSVWSANGTIQTSHASLKTEIAPLPSTLAIVAALNPVTFKWINGGAKPVISQVEIEEDVYETVTEAVDDHEVQPDGSVHLVSKVITKRRRVFDDIPVTLPDGTPVVDQVPVTIRGKATTYVARPRMHSVARKQQVVTDQVTYVEQPGRRTHWGFMAADVKAAMDKTGLDFGGYVKDEHGVEHLRPDQLLPVLWRAVQQLAADFSAYKAAHP